MIVVHQTRAMIDKPMSDKDINSFIGSSGKFHQAGIEKYGKAYKQRSHDALVSMFFTIIEQLNANTSLEIGAFQAEFSRKFIASSPTHRALAVEANPHNYKKFKPSLTAAGVIYHHAAVHDREGPCELQLHVTDIDIENGYIRGNNSILKSDARPDTQAVTVPGTTLDTLVKNYVESESIPDPEISHPVLWIDVEGALDLVISGGSQTIVNSLVIFAEVETERLWDNQATFIEVATQLDKLGFSPWLRDCEYEPEQFNVMFTNRKLVDNSLLESLATQFHNELQPAE